MKRSHPSSDESEDEGKSSRSAEESPRKSRPRDYFVNESYYQIRRGKKQSSSSPPVTDPFIKRLDTSKDQFNRESSLKRSESFEHRVHFCNEKKESNRSYSFDKKDQAESSSKIEFQHQGFNIKLPSSFPRDQLVKQFGDQVVQPTTTDVDMGTSEKFKIQTAIQTDDLNSTKQEFESLSRSKGVSYKIEYSVKITINDNHSVNTVVSNSPISFEDAELSAYSSAISNLQSPPIGLRNQPKTQTRVQPSMPEKQIVVQQRMKQTSQDVEITEEKDDLIDDLKKLLMRQDLRLLFKEEIPDEYLRFFGRKIEDDWFDKVQVNESFKTEKLPGNFTIVKIH